MSVDRVSNDEIYAAAGLKNARGYPLTDADTRHDPHCEWHWCNRCNCSQALKSDAIIAHVVGRFREDLAILSNPPKASGGDHG